MNDEHGCTAAIDLGAIANRPRRVAPYNTYYTGHGPTIPCLMTFIEEPDVARCVNRVLDDAWWLTRTAQQTLKRLAPRFIENCFGKSAAPGSVLMVVVARDEPLAAWAVAQRGQLLDERLSVGACRVPSSYLLDPEIRRHMRTIDELAPERAELLTFGARTRRMVQDGRAVADVFEKHHFYPEQGVRPDEVTWPEAALMGDRRFDPQYGVVRRTHLTVVHLFADAPGEKPPVHASELCVATDGDGCPVNVCRTPDVLDYAHLVAAPHQAQLLRENGFLCRRTIA